jgi:uncharacterized protein YqgV (UPF0045/DUF77 family)
MKVLASLEVQPLKVRAGHHHPTTDAVASTQRILDERGLRFETRATVTEVEGELADVLGAVEAMPPALHDLGHERVLLTVKVESDRTNNPRLDRGPTD